MSIGSSEGKNWDLDRYSKAKKMTKNANFGKI